MNEIQVTLRGNVATNPRHFEFGDGNAVTSFRMATTSRWFDRERNEWVNRNTTYLSVNCRRALAENAYASLMKGQPVVVTGRIHERFWEAADGRKGHTLEVEAITLGHDLAYGETKYTRIAQSEKHAPDPQGDAVTDQVMQDATREDRDQRLTDVSGFTVLEDGGPEPEDDDELEDSFEEFAMPETVSA